MAIVTYQDALDYLYRFVDPARKPAQNDLEAHRHLELVQALLAAFGDPQHALRCVVVAGTKGKGSTCALIEAMARAAGLRTGLWTSPHLNSYRERIQVDRVLISQAELVTLVQRWQPTIDAFAEGPYGAPSTFDIGFALALSHFAAQQVDLAVIEVGLGGTYDAANVLTPLVSVISAISYDHMAILGRTLAEIAANKAGIMKPGVPAVTVPQPPEAAAVIQATASAVGAPLWTATPDQIQPDQPARPALPYPVPPMPAQLGGAFQHENARLALAAALHLHAAGLPIHPAACSTGLAEATWPGRFERVPSAPAFLLDGAHNDDSARRLAAAIRAELHYQRLILVLGTSRDKDIHAIAAPLVPLASTVILTRSEHSRAMDLDRIAQAVAPHLHGELLMSADIATALDLACRHANPADLIVVTGSLFLVGAAREALGLAVSD